METVRTVLYAVLIALGIRTFAYEPFNIPSGSMVPTLLEGDYLFVSKMSYGYSKHSFPFSPPLFEGRIWGGQPERGDVVVFKLPTDNSTDYIKRIIGLPGDRVQVIGGILHLNGEPVPRERLPDYAGDGVFAPTPQYLEVLPNTVRHRILERSDEDTYDNTQEYLVPAGHFFAMGDNRDNSADSRADVGFVPEENLVGRAEFLFFSTNGAARWWEVWRWPWTIRYDRLLQPVE